MTTTPTARDTDWKAMYFGLLADWARVSEHVGIEAETAGDIINAIAAVRADAADAAQQDWETARITIAAFEQEVARLREALVEVADWFDTRPLSDLGIVGIGYIGPEVVESADAVADIVRAALRAAPVAADGCRGDSEAERNRLRYLLNKAGDLIVGMGISDWQRPVWERDRWDLLGEMDEALGRSPNPHTAGLSAWKERP